jgi:hypothetical protein
MEFPEGADMKPPRRFLFLFGGYYFSTRRTALFAEDWVTFG